MKDAVNKWAEKSIIFQGNRDYDGAATVLETDGIIKPAWQKALDMLRTADIPVDIVFKQGVDVLGLK